MKLCLYCILFLLLFSSSTFAQHRDVPLLLNQQGVLIEAFDSTVTAENKYTDNNLLFRVGSRFTYRYSYIDESGQHYLQKITPNAHPDREKAWKLVPLHQKDSLTNDRLQLIVATDLQGIKTNTPGYNHTPIRYEYLAPAGPLYFLEHKSLVENKANIWLQPPTARLFRILALNPFPFIKAPFKPGNSWQWQQKVPSYWSDSRWKEWSSPVSITYQYAISHEESVATPFGLLQCLVVKATGSSELGNTSLMFYFHPQLGFIKLLFTNINGSKLLMELVEVK